MTATTREPRRRPRERASSPSPLGMTLRRGRRRLARQLRRLVRNLRAWRRDRRDREGQPNWKRGRRRVAVAKVVVYVLAALLTVWVLRALASVIVGRPVDVLVNPDTACTETPFSCGVMSGIVLTLLSFVLGTLVFRLLRLNRVRRPYIKKAKDKPEEVVPTAGSMLGEIVGRDELCRVISSDLCDRESRRPHILIGGVGTGKTAVMVQLTKRLAETGAVPVPVRLTDATDGLDFRALAKRRFVASAEGALLSSGEGEAVWRQLCREDRVVVLADGLEEALVEGDAERDRDNLIRLAIREAKDQQLPLVIASRPHTPLAGMEAALVELEPLSEEDSLQYLTKASADGDERRLDWIVETAQAIEAPLYLQESSCARRPPSGTRTSRRSTSSPPGCTSTPSAPWTSTTT